MKDKPKPKNRPILNIEKENNRKTSQKGKTAKQIDQG